MQINKDIGILIHGCHLQAKGWEHVIWGSPNTGYSGRASRGIQLAMSEFAGLIYWGTGASEKEGKKESQYTFEYAVARSNQLPCFEGFDTYEIESILKRISFIDTETRNTAEEVERAITVCRNQDIRRLLLVSSSTHVARCLQEVLKLRADGRTGKLEIFACPSDTDFPNSVPADVAIIEPPHRADMPSWQTHRYTIAMLDVMKQGEDVFNRYLADWGMLLSSYNVPIKWGPRV